MHWREKLQTPEFTAQKKLCFDNIVSPMSYKLNERQPFWISSPMMKMEQSLCALQWYEKVSNILLPVQRRVHLVQDN